ncbi:MAG: endonuclease VIII [Woeseiaceae bacterium]|nr:endonuclease VIII [Woeseiaceae bacterium]
MPEGPEIRRAADRIADVLVGPSLDNVWFAFARLEPFVPELSGARVTAIDTLGKAMLTRFDNDLTLYSHNQLYGRWITCRRDDPPETNRSLRVALHTSTHSALLYSASDVDVLDPEALARHPFIERAGPDVLDETLGIDDLVERLGSRAFRNRALGGTYLDQSFVAGIGNYLRSEILFCAGAHPADRPADLDAGALRALARETLRVSRRSYRSGGITVTSKIERSLRAAGQKRSEYRFWIYGRDGKDCRRCDTQIERMDVASRGLFYCPACQPRRR